MKMKLADFEESVVAFLRKAVGTMPTTGHKFVAGVMLASSAAKAETVLACLADAEGCIDTDSVRKLVADGLAASGDRITFTVGDERLSWALKPVSVTFTAADIESALTEAEARFGR